MIMSRREDKNIKRREVIRGAWERYEENLEKRLAERNKRRERYEAVKAACFGSPIRYMFIFAGIIVAATILQGVLRSTLAGSENLAEAFAAVKSESVDSGLVVTAYYGDVFMTEQDKRTLVEYLARKLGLKNTYEISASLDDEKSQVFLVKEARHSVTQLKCITLDGKHYLKVQLDIYDDSNYDIIEYMEIIRQTMEELGITEPYITLQLLGNYKGRLTLDEMNRLADDVITELEGEIVIEDRTEQRFSVYAYTGRLKEYVEVGGSKINMQIAARYRSDTDCTEIYLASPIINEDW